ncbi:MAG TPA: GapR family DNA-binding domain-containing protein [Acetobacteraceae bacterium]|nr:GapR family DNA-binding domain-containing protein [Acetobacteraceae bacterium]
MAVRAVEKTDTKTGGIAADRLRSIVERIERLEEERKELGNDIKDIYAEAKSAGFDVKVLRQLIRIRKQEAAEVEEQESLLDVYRRALGM